MVQATGWGKSAVYWAATAANRAAGGVVLPLQTRTDLAELAGSSGIPYDL